MATAHLSLACQAVRGWEAPSQTLPSDAHTANQSVCSDDWQVCLSSGSDSGRSQSITVNITAYYCDCYFMYCCVNLLIIASDKRLNVIVCIITTPLTLGVTWYSMKLFSPYSLDSFFGSAITQSKGDVGYNQTGPTSAIWLNEQEPIRA